MIGRTTFDCKRSRLQWAGAVDRRPAGTLAEAQTHHGHRRWGRSHLSWEDWVRRDMERSGDEERGLTNKVIEQYLII